MSDYNDLANEMLTDKEKERLDAEYPEYRRMDKWHLLYDFGRFCDEDKWHTSMLVEWMAEGLFHIFDGDSTFGGYTRPKGVTNGLEHLRQTVEGIIAERNEDAKWTLEDNPEDWKRYFGNHGCEEGTAFTPETMLYVRKWLYETTPFTIYKMYVKIRDAAQEELEENLLAMTRGEKVDLTTAVERNFEKAMDGWMTKTRMQKMADEMQAAHG